MATILENKAAKAKRAMTPLQTVSPEVAAFLAKGKNIKTVVKGVGSSVAKLTPLMREITGQTRVVCIGQRSDDFKGRDQIRQRSQKIKWTWNVRNGMASTFQNREHAKMVREGLIPVEQGISTLCDAMLIAQG